MRYLLFVFSLIIINLVTGYAGDCDDVTCPDGWLLGETGWVVLQFNNNIPPDYCVGKICYCYDLDTLDEGPHFFIKKVVWQDSTCYLTNYSSIDYDILKLNMMSELTRIIHK